MEPLTLSMAATIVLIGATLFTTGVLVMKEIIKSKKKRKKMREMEEEVESLQDIRKID